MPYVRLLPELAAALLLAACGPAGTTAAITGSDAVRIPPVPVPRAVISPNPIPAVLKVPEGPGPFPAVIVLHGCSGFGGGLSLWASRLNSWGYAALMPDSLTPRGVSAVCGPLNSPLVTPRDRAADVGAAAAWLRTQPRIDPNRIAVLGLSHGGATAALTVQRLYQPFHLRAAVDYYGTCRDPQEQGATPLLALAGEADDWGSPALTCRAYAASVEPGRVAEVHTYPGVHHAFENPSLTYKLNFGHILAYDQAAADDSFTRVHAFLDQWVKP